MGIEITARDNMVPTSIVVTLECDAATEMFCHGFQTFEHPDGFVGAHRDAMAKGWLERHGPHGRTWLCPECSGKAPREA